MATLTGAQVYQLALQAGLNPPAAAIATAIAKGESGWRTDAMGDVSLQDGKWGPSVGLWQIRSVKAENGTGGTRDASRLTDPASNARSMVAISSGGSSWTPWTIYKNGAYKKYLGDMGGNASGENSATGPLSYTPDGVLVPAGTQTSPASGDSNSDGALFGDGGLVDKLNPFDDWAQDGLELGVKLLASGVAAALVVIGLTRTVSRS